MDGAAFLPANQVEYERASRQLFKFLHDHAPVVELDKLDGFFLDLTGCERWMKVHPLKWMERLVGKLYGDLGLPASFGIGTNKLVAKIAARVAKPGDPARGYRHVTNSGQRPNNTATAITPTMIHSGPIVHLPSDRGRTPPRRRSCGHPYPARIPLGADGTAARVRAAPRTLVCCARFASPLSPVP